MTNLEEAQLIVKTARTDCQRLGLPFLMVVAPLEEGKVISTGGGLEKPEIRAFIAGAAMSLIAKATAATVTATAPRVKISRLLPKSFPASTPFPDQKPPNGSS